MADWSWFAHSTLPARSFQEWFNTPTIAPEQEGDFVSNYEEEAQIGLND